MTLLFSFVDIARVILITAIFAYASKQDIQTRRITNTVWRVLIICGLLLIGVDIYTEPVTIQYALQIVANIFVASVLAGLLQVTGLFGMADVKAFIAVGIALPTFPDFGVIPFSLPHYAPPADAIFPLPIITILINLSFFLPVFLLYIVYKNFLNGDISRTNNWVWLYAYRVPVSNLENTFGTIVSPWMENLENTSNTPESIFQAIKLSQNGLPTHFIMDFLEWKREVSNDKTIELTEVDIGTDVKYFLDSDETVWEPVQSVSLKQKIQQIFSDESHSQEPNLNEEVQRVQKLTEQESVWVTPGIPFIVPMTLGILTTIFIGDLLFLLLLIL